MSTVQTVDIPALVEMLGQVDPKKPLGTELFNALARLTITVAVEAVCLKKNPTTGKIEVYLVQRSPTDSAYAGQWHCPGSAFRPGEDELNVFWRLSRNEFGGELENWKFLFNFNNRQEARGHFFSAVYLCKMAHVKGRGTWFPVDQLPEVTVEHHRDNIIPMTVQTFNA